MTNTKKVSILIFLLLLALTGYILSSFEQVVDEVTPVDAELEVAVISCDGITERAAAHLVAVVDFQKLEIAGRKARVFKVCMKDHGYIENKDWLAYSMPLADRDAQETKVSVDEALENLRRINMVVPTGEHARPPYWIRPEHNT